jgi:hypothetical protein
VPGTDPAGLAEPLRKVAEGISNDPLLRERLSGGLQIVLAADGDADA